LRVANIDHESRSPASAAQAAERLLDGLAPSDLLGLYVYPDGSSIAPTTERAPVRAALGTVLGRRPPLRSQFNLSPTEIVDITAASTSASTFANAARADDPLFAVQQRECPNDRECTARIFREAQALALHLEGQASVSLGGLHQFLRSLASCPGRKDVVFLSAGVIVSDRPGGRPDVGDLTRVMGETAARANVALYTVHVDQGFFGLYSATRSRAVGEEQERDRVMSGQWLEAFSDAAGGP
jgi:hypothetical protein